MARCRAAWARVTWLCELFGRAKTTLCACEPLRPSLEVEACCQRSDGSVRLPSEREVSAEESCCESSVYHLAQAPRPHRKTRALGPSCSARPSKHFLETADKVSRRGRCKHSKRSPSAAKKKQPSSPTPSAATVRDAQLGRFRKASARRQQPAQAKNNDGALDLLDGHQHRRPARRPHHVRFV